jgi:hypothetical protein
MQLTKSSDAALQGLAVHTLESLVFNHRDNQSAAGAAGAVECMCNLLSSDYALMAFAAADALNYLSGLADNARRAVSMGAVALLLQLKARSGGHESIDQVLARLAQVATDDAVDEDNFRSGPVFISGASGDSAAADAEQKVSNCCMVHKEALAVDALARACVL